MRITDEDHPTRSAVGVRRRSSLRRKAGAVSAGALFVATAAACGAATVDQAEMEQQISDQLAESVGQTPESVECPDDIEAEVGAQGTCVLTAEDGTEFDVAVEVTSAEDGEYEFEAEVAQSPNNWTRAPSAESGTGPSVPFVDPRLRSWA